MRQSTVVSNNAIVSELLIVQGFEFLVDVIQHAVMNLFEKSLRGEALSYDWWSLRSWSRIEEERERRKGRLPYIDEIAIYV